MMLPLVAWGLLEREGHWCEKPLSSLACGLSPVCTRAHSLSQFTAGPLLLQTQTASILVALEQL